MQLSQYKENKNDSINNNNNGDNSKNKNDDDNTIIIIVIIISSLFQPGDFSAKSTTTMCIYINTEYWPEYSDRFSKVRIKSKGT